MIEDSLGYVDCQIHSVHEAGDHFVVIGRVLDLGDSSEAGGDAEKPLLFFQGKYASTDD
jgi:3-hydroxy-9,10-secoandrosta-1,3,5(10)-triene-9,17-dione monooxygenase reductase component